ncbi:MAG TPA: type I glyceraldehyde-3-phosphate dehydrogenase [Patescibacteria group bacterium]|nr:type I glyceraldehyde-3-phosphate dehydrogenase [Patescibacteria group bacterium]
MTIAINGFGRIGRTFFRAAAGENSEIVAINDLTEVKTLAHLLKYDSTYGKFEGDVEVRDGQLRVDTIEIKVFAEKEPAKLPWKDLGIDLVIESTGVFTDYNGASGHLEAGAKYVIVTAPTKGEKEIKTLVLGVNEKDFNPQEDKIISMASCTTNCLVPVADILNKNFGILKSSMSTIHAYTMDQRLQDDEHKDLRRARAAGLSIIPTTTGATTATCKVLPELRGKMDGLSYRVPVATVSVIDFVALLSKNASIQEINEAFEKASRDPAYQGALGVTSEPLVSADFRGDPHGAIVDLLSTQVIDGNLVRVVAWYDNEMGYSKRLAAFCKYIESKIKT